MRLLVLGARATGLIAAARARGLFVLAVDRDPRAPGFALAHRRAILGCDDEPALERLVEAARIEGVIATGPETGAAARVAARFRLPHPHAPETAVLLGSRLRQRERLRDAGVPQLRWALVAKGADAGFPCVVTPRDRKGRRLAEEAPGAAEVTVTAFSAGGVLHPLLGSGPAAALARRSAEALGVTDGITSTRLRLGVDGPRVVDVRAHAGDREAELCRLLHGIDVHALALDAAFGRSRSAEDVRFGSADAQVA
ncbi:MAG TPA: hypothetical protein VLD13_07155 [Gaiellaceae bacterium]|nr:hypothetical protein [Gaiellaceae bacterium]